MAAIEQIRAILASNPDIEVAELKEVIKTCVKVKRVSTVQKNLRELVKTHDKMTLARLRKELKMAYAEVHKDDDESDAPVCENAYRQYVKEQTAVMREEDMWKDAPQPLRMVEIGKRWKLRKQAAAAVADAAAVELPSDDEGEQPSQPQRRGSTKRKPTTDGNNKKKTRKQK